jgi:hypothetical protein
MYWKQNKDYLSESYLNEAPPRPRPNFGDKPPKKKPGFFKRFFGSSKPVRGTPTITTPEDNNKLHEFILELIRERRGTSRRPFFIARMYIDLFRNFTSPNSQAWQRFLRGFRETNWQLQTLPDEILFFLNNMDGYFGDLRFALVAFARGEIPYAQLKEQIDKVVKMFEDLRGGRYFNPNFDPTRDTVPEYMRDLDPEVYEYIEQLYQVLRMLQEAEQRALSR